MAVTIDRNSSGPNRRRLPIQIANEEKMVRATIELLGEHDVGAITSRMIAERSGTATNYITRYFGGRDALLSAVAEELGWRIADRMTDFGSEPGGDDPLTYLEAVMTLPEVGLWFRLFRYLASRNVLRERAPGTRSPVAEACERAVARIFGLEGEDVIFWANVLLTYLMGGLAFGELLGTSSEEGGRVLARLGRTIEALRDDVSSPDPPT